MHPKGRVLQPEETAALQGLLGDRALRRDELIEYLHVIQDAEGCLPAGHLHALAEAMKLPMAEVYEVATFYAHFDVVGDGEPRPAALTVRVCDSLSCMLAGAETLIIGLQKDIAGKDVRVVRAPCMGRCAGAPAVEVGHRHIEQATVAGVRAVIAAGDTHCAAPAYQSLDSYRADGAYRSLRACLDGTLKPEEVIAALSDSGLRGLGGAGFPTGRKWGLVRAEPGPRLLAVNGDEGEPGTFKDRVYLESRPHQFIEGMLVAAWAIEAKDVYLYMRDEYPAVLAILGTELADISAAGLSPHTKVHVRRGAGAYICGEESAMIESIEGKRGLPRHRPPYVAQVGVFNRPTLVNNVETLAAVSHILNRGAAWYKGLCLSNPKSTGTKLFSVCGHVMKPGNFEVTMGFPMKDLIHDLAGGMRPGRRLKAVIPGGSSVPIMTAAEAESALCDYEGIVDQGSMLGSAGFIVMDDSADIVYEVYRLAKFYAHESCAQCTQCREGTAWTTKILERILKGQGKKEDLDLLLDLSDQMTGRTICVLSDSCAAPIVSGIKKFPEEFDAYLSRAKAPALASV